MPNGHDGRAQLSWNQPHQPPLDCIEYQRLSSQPALAKTYVRYEPPLLTLVAAGAPLISPPCGTGVSQPKRVVVPHSWLSKVLWPKTSGRAPSQFETAGRELYDPGSVVHAACG